MRREKNLQHWDDWALKFGTNLRSTTKCQSIKALEIAALSRGIESALRAQNLQRRPRILEVGCGNGFNGIALLNAFPEILWLGVDFSREMVQQARLNIAQSTDGSSDRIAVVEGDALTLSRSNILSKFEELSRTFREELEPVDFDIIYTDRCLINLASAQEQVSACENIRNLLTLSGRFLMLENSVQTHFRLNDLREKVGLQRREVADFNVFIDEGKVLPCLEPLFDLISVEDFGSLHDVILYVLKPGAHENNEIVYDDPMMQTVTSLLLAMGSESATAFGGFGQNRLWAFVAK